jgi:acetyl-CoA carboxylase biotin carboxyl carrier protein
MSLGSGGGKRSGGGLTNMESIEQDDILFILKLLDESKFEELCLETGNLKLIARKQGEKEIPAAGDYSVEERVFSPDAQEIAPEGRSQDRESSCRMEDAVLLPEDQDGAILIKAPLLGTFYRSPKPGAPPFVEEGKMVTEDDVVCIIEVMKLFNTVKAGVRGRIKKVLAKNGQMVEFQQPLFVIRPAGGEEGKTPGA